MVKSPSKKRAKITLAKFNVLTKQEQSIISVSTDSTTSGVLQERSLVNTSSTSVQKTSSKVFYHIKKPNEGIDMSSFRSSLLDGYSLCPTILTNISKSTTMRWNMYPLKKSNISLSPISSSWCNVPQELVNKNRCTVEDVMIIAKGTKITLLLPKLPKDGVMTNIHRSLCIDNSKSYLQFGNNRSVKYYVFTGDVVSNPYQERAKCDGITTSEINASFNKLRCNGYGIVLRVAQSRIEFTGESNAYSNTTDVTFRWLDLFMGRRNGLQLWSHTSDLRDYTANFNISFNSEYSEIEMENKITVYLSIIYDEIYGDKIAVMNLIAKYYMVLNRRKKTVISNYENRKKIPLSIDFSKTAYSITNNIIENTFEAKLKLCYTDFNKITQPLLSRDDIIDLYK